MANIGANTNHMTGTGRSYNTPEKQFGKDIGQAKYQAKPEFADKFNAPEAMNSQSLHAGEVTSKLDSIVVRGKEILKTAGTYVKENRKVVIGAAVALSAVGVGAYLLNERRLNQRKFNQRKSRR